MNNFERPPAGGEVAPQEQERHVESRETKAEAKEDSYEDAIKGAEILEEPKDGSFVHALQVFVAWVQSLINSKKD